MNPNSRAKARRSVLVLCAVLVPAGANAFTVSSPLSQGCHELITSQALRAVRIDTPNAMPLATNANEQALVQDVQFVPDPDMKDLGGTTLLLSVRDNDLKGRSSDDLTSLAEVHGDPNNQQEHCLRAADQVEPGGSASAVAACRAFILGRVSQALDGLDAQGVPDTASRTVLTVHLSIRGQMDAPLPTYYVRMGQALHALQDSFSHAYRAADGGMQVTVILNWLGIVNGNLVESRDGPAHNANLDVCNDPDPLRTQRHALATLASEAVLRATLNPTLTRDQKMTAVTAVLDTYLGYSPGCTFANQWCQAPERQYVVSSLGCGSSSGPGSGVAAGAVLTLIGAVLLARKGRGLWGWARPVAVFVALVSGSAVKADEPLPTVQSAEHSPPPPVTQVVAEPGLRDPSAVSWGASAAVAASVNNAALAGTLGLRLHLSKHWTLGLSGEWNPWIPLNGTALRAGVVNIYGSGILRFPLAYENFNLRVTASLGASYLLSNLYGAGAGSLGLYAGFSPLGLEWKVSRLFFLVINPLSIALPVPQLRGVPLDYPQYRFSIGLEVSFS